MTQIEQVITVLKSQPLTQMQDFDHLGSFEFEEWKDAGTVEPKMKGYAVSSKGRIKSLQRKVRHSLGGLRTLNERILKPCNNSGYLHVSLGKKRGTFLIHRIVALAFVENTYSKPCVNHIDGDKSNNNVSNLEWCSYSENEKHSYSVLKKAPSKTGLGKFGELSHSSKRVASINSFGEAIHAWGSASEAARNLNTSQGHISAICRNERPSTFEFSLRYISADEYEIIKNRGVAIHSEQIAVKKSNGKIARVAVYSMAG